MLHRMTDKQKATGGSYVRMDLVEDNSIDDDEPTIIFLEDESFSHSVFNHSKMNDNSMLRLNTDGDQEPIPLETLLESKCTSNDTDTVSFSLKMIPQSKFRRHAALLNYKEVINPVALSWKHLSVEVPIKSNINYMNICCNSNAKRNQDSNSRPTTKFILNDVSGFIKPGGVLCILGPSGCGKTTLLQTLCGIRRPSAGSIFYDGKIKRKKNIQIRDPMGFNGNAAYVAQDIVLLGSLTVRECLRYAAKLKVSEKVEDPEEFIEQTINYLGLNVCADTIVGNQFIKGISGGQKKRLFIGIELMSQPALLFMDEVTSGLDSTSAYHIFAILHRLSQLGHSIILTLHQPSSRLFDIMCRYNYYMCIMQAGRVMYFGKCNYAMHYFKKIGYPTPPHMNPIDFFIDVINDDFRDSSHTSKRVHKPSNINDINTYQAPMEPLTSTMNNDTSTTLNISIDDDENRKRLTTSLDVSVGDDDIIEMKHNIDMNSEIDIEDDDLGISFSAYTNADDSEKENTYISIYKQYQQYLQTQVLEAIDQINSNQLQKRKEFEKLLAYLKNEKLKNAKSDVNIYLHNIQSLENTDDDGYASSTGLSSNIIISKYIQQKSAQYKKKHLLHWSQQSLILISRNIKSDIRNISSYWIRIIMYVLLCLCIGSMYFDIGSTVQHVNDRVSILFFVVTFLTFLSIAGVPSFLELRSLYIKERLNNHYSPLAYCVANFVSSVPWILLISVLVSFILFFMIHSHSYLDGEYFAVYVLNIFLTAMCAESMMVCISAVSEQFIVAFALAGGLMALYVALCGFFILPQNIPWYWLWIHYGLSFHTYSFQIFMFNEFHGFVEDAVNGEEILEEYSLTDVNIFDNFLVLIGMMMFYRLVFYVLLKFFVKSKT